MSREGYKKLVETRDHPWNQHNQDLRLLELIKLVVLFPLVVIRLLFLLVMVLVGQLFLVPVGWYMDRQKGVHSPRLRWVVSKVCAFLSRCILFSIGIYYLNVTGHQFVREKNGKKVVFVGNHSSPVDGFVVNYAFPFPVGGVSKKGLAKVFFLGSFTKAMEFCMIDHSTAGAGGSAQVVEYIQNPAKPNIALFPEGTTTNGTLLIQFRKSAFVAGHPVQPYIIRFPSIFFAPTMTELNHFFLFYRMFCAVYTPCHLIVLPVHVPSEEELADPALFAENVRREMAQVGDLPLCEISGIDLLKRNHQALNPWRKWRFRWL